MLCEVILVIIHILLNHLNNNVLFPQKIGLSMPDPKSIPLRLLHLLLSNRSQAFLTDLGIPLY